MWQPGMALVDFTNPEARATGSPASSTRCSTWAWTPSRPTSASASPPTWSSIDGSDPRADAQLLHLPVQPDRLRRCCGKRRGEDEAVVFARSATAGGQQFPVHWGGDCESTFESMAESPARRAVAGDVRLRLLEPRHRRLRGHAERRRCSSAGSPSACSPRTAGCTAATPTACPGSSTRSPWTCCAPFTRLKLRLMPYLYEAAAEAHTGRPDDARDGRWSSRTTRPAPPGPAVHARRLPAGRAGLHRRRPVDYYVPDGAWTHLLTGARWSGPRWLGETARLRLPAPARPPRHRAPARRLSDRPDYDYAAALTLRIYEPADGAHGDHPDPRARRQHGRGLHGHPHRGRGHRHLRGRPGGLERGTPLRRRCCDCAAEPWPAGSRAGGRLGSRRWVGCDSRWAGGPAK